MRKSIRPTTLAFGLGLALSLAGSQLARAQSTDAGRPQAGREEGRGPGGRGGRRGGPEGFLLRGITLTDAQKAQLQKLREQDRTQMEARRDAFEKERTELQALRAKGDTAAVRARLTQRRAQMEQERDRRTAAIRNVLTAEQRAAFDKNVAEAKQREQERAQRGDGVGHRGEGRGRKGGEGRGGQQGSASRSGR